MAGNKFVTLEVSDKAELVQFIEANHESCPEALWTKPQNLHITLRYYIKLPDEKQLFDSLRKISQNVAPFAMPVRGVSSFGRRVLYAVPHNTERIVALGTRLDNMSLKPHITLAKMDKRGEFCDKFVDLVDANGSYDFGQLTADTLTVYETVGGGQPYNSLYSVKLLGKAVDSAF